ncbi:MAG: hypothetical protein RBS77_05335 [Candidatus Moranbacteria bacterium]|jgi:hypothetical protein|nr:hypothetical protein [Candidatus Moranbacteria bacterium]
MNYKNYLQLKKLYDANDFEKLLKDSDSLLFLKIRAITRKSLLVEFANKIGLDSNQGTNALIEQIVDNSKTKKEINDFIDSKFQDDRKERRKYEDKLISELYKLKVFDWGGLYQNNLERTIVDNYIKKIKNFDTLMDKVDNEIHESLKGYVLCSWYNHWTSILIEDIFKEHKRVLPAIGLIKKVDFFVDEIPFDLKVTYFPDGFMAEKRKEKGLKPELTELKQIAKANKIKFDSSQKNKFLLSELLTRLSESHLEPVKKAIIEFHETRWKIIEEAMKNKKELIKWLYEEQGERRFDSANRLFLVLIEKDNIEESWKLKRNIDFLRESIGSYLDQFKINNGLEINFNWKDEKYTSVSDALFIVKK